MGAKSSERRWATLKVPLELLNRAQAATGASPEETVREGLRLIVVRGACEALRERRGKVKGLLPLPVLRLDRT